MFISDVLFGKSVEGVLHGFYRAIEDLKDVAEKHSSLAAKKADIVSDLREDIADHKDEVSKALKIVAKLEDIFNA